MECPECKCPLDDSTPKHANAALICPFCGHHMNGREMVTKTERGELIGWRAWNVAETPDGVRLQSQFYGGRNADTIWHPDRENEASCASGCAGDANGVHPNEGCGCGFYAARTREHLIGLDAYHRYDRHSEPVVMGQVAMWGKVMLATNGFRAQFVRPLEVYVPYELYDVATKLQAVYGPHGVKIDLDNTLALPKTDGPAWCVECGAKLPKRSPKCDLCNTLNEVN